MQSKQLLGQKHRRYASKVRIYKSLPAQPPRIGLWKIDALELLRKLPQRPLFDLVITSPPYNIGKAYESRITPQKYLDWQRQIIKEIVDRTRYTGSICWQVGNYVENGKLEPLDVMLHPIMIKLGLQLRNRIIWHFGHGLHCKKRFSGRYEVVLWYTKSDKYVFNLDSVRIQPKYPGKKAYRGARYGELSSNPKGKNPEDVWQIPNVNGNHREKTSHPCQFPVGLAERLVLALSNRRGLVFDPFCGSGSTGVAAAANGRDFWGSDLVEEYLLAAKDRIDDATNGTANYRPHDKPIYDYRKSSLSRISP